MTAPAVTLPEPPVPGFPSRFGRNEESALLDLIASGSLVARRWRAAGPPRFMAGVAVFCASLTGFDRAAYLRLAEAIDPGATELERFDEWLRRTPVSAPRFAPMLRRRIAERA